MSTNTARKAKRQKTDNDSSTGTAAEDVRNNASSPTEEDISLALCKIGDTGKYTNDEVKKASDNLCTWRITSNNNQDECARISKEFIALGGIPRILNSIQRNKENVGFMLRASRIIQYFLSAGSNNEHIENASTIAQQFVEREGVELMLSIIKEKYIGELDINQLDTLNHIFGLFDNTMWNMNKKNMVDIDKFLPIIDVGISTLAILSNISTHIVVVARIKTNIFIFFNNFVAFNAEMMDVVDFQEKNIFLKCIRALKNTDNTWKYDKQAAWKYASTFFYTCCMGSRIILSRECDFEVIVPFLIQFMKEDPDNVSPMVFGLLRKASDIIGKKKMITSNKGVLGLLGTVADRGNEEAIILMKHLFEEY